MQLILIVKIEQKDEVTIQFVNNYHAWNAKGFSIFSKKKEEYVIYMWKNIDMPYLDNAIIEDVLLFHPNIRNNSNFLFIYPEEYKDKWHKHIFLPIRNFVYADEFKSLFGQELIDFLSDINIEFNICYKKCAKKLILQYYWRHVQALKLLTNCFDDENYTEEIKMALHREIIICETSRSVILTYIKDLDLATKYVQEELKCRMQLLNTKICTGYTFVDQMRLIYQRK